MSCQTCKKMIDTSIPEIELNYSTTAQVSPRSLVRKPHKPSKGWEVILPIKGQPQIIKGDNPYEVVANAKRIIKLNGFRVKDSNLWFNLNIQWLQRTLPKYREVTLEYLLETAMGNELSNNDIHAQKKDNSWIPWYVESIRSYLNAENYQWEEFKLILARFQRMLDPVENPLLGSVSVHIVFARNFELIKNSPIYNKEDAQIWFNNLKF